MTASKPRKLKTHCSYGHEFTKTNTYWSPEDRFGRRRRTCRACKREICRLFRLGCTHGYPCSICKTRPKRGIRAAVAKAEGKS